MSYKYYQVVGGEEAWKPVATSMIDTVGAVMFQTILAVDSPIGEDFTKEQYAGVKYKGPLYFDLDDADSPASTAVYAVELIDKLIELGIEPKQLHIFASGSKGFHILVPEECFFAKPVKAGMIFLPAVFKEMAFKLSVESLDLRVYTARKGRMLRCANVQRPNGLYKVALSYDDLVEIARMAGANIADGESFYKQACAAPRPDEAVKVDAPTLAHGLMALFDECKTKVSKAQVKAKKAKKLVLPAELPSWDALLQGRGLKDDVGFHPIAMQVAITAHARGMSLDELLGAAEGLIENHVGDGHRYNSASKRRVELARMYDYTDDNPCYSYGAGAISALLAHSALDLKGLEVSREEVEQAIENPEAATDGDEYEHAGIVLTEQGAFTMTENGPKQVLALGFQNVTELRSAETGTVTVLEADLTISGRPAGRRVMELETFNSVGNINKMAMPYGQAFTGTETQARGLYMRLVERARRTNNCMFTVAREGLDIIAMPFHEDEEVRRDFLVWSDQKAVSPQASIRDKGINLRFVGFPTTQGQFQSDLSQAPRLTQWLKEDEANDNTANKDLLRQVVSDLLTCQKPSYLGKLMGWMVACHYRMLFHRLYSKFPLLHINGAAGMGKCFAKGTPIMMHDGKCKSVEDVQVGDFLMGPDGKSRKVLSLGRGQEAMYRVSQIYGDDYVVNESHILSLLNEAGKVKNLTVRAYRAKTESWKAKHKGWKVEGVCQGDLTPSTTGITVTPEGMGDYYGFTIDGDHLFLLGDFTVAHNTEMTKLFARFHYYLQEPKMLTPTSTLFAVSHAASGSASIPLILDEFKPSEMSETSYHRFKLMLRDAYNCRPVERGGGNRENSDYRAVHTTHLSAPICFIAESVESEPALMERVVLLTLSKPPVIEAQKFLAKFQNVTNNGEILGMIGAYMAASIVQKYSLEALESEFTPIYNETRKHLMLQEGEGEELSQDQLAKKSGAKERTVYNYAVTRFGLSKFAKLIEAIFPGEFTGVLASMQEGMYSTIVELQEQTQPEWLKVLNTFADLSLADPTAPYHLRKGVDYEFVQQNNKECIEIYARACYMKYRAYQSFVKTRPLFPNDSSFIHALNTIPALVSKGKTVKLQSPGGSHVLALDELRGAGFVTPGKV